MRKDPNTRRELEATVSVVRWHGNGEEGWNLRIEDAASGLQVIEVKLSNEQFGQMIGAQVTKAEASYWANPNIGKRLEHATISADLFQRDFPRTGMDEAEAAQLAETRALVVRTAMVRQGFSPEDGWEAEALDHYNGHRRNELDRYDVQVRRWVDPSA